MPGSGFLTFTDGSILTAAQVNGYLMKQAVMYFATAAARSSAITSPEEGMVTYRADSDVIEYYNGTAWIGITDVSSSQLVSNKILNTTEERWNIVASAATGTINFDVLTSSVWYYTSNSTANHTLNVRGNSGTTLNSILAVGDSITVVWLNTNGTTPYWPSTFQVDGSTITPRWQGGLAPAGGNASATDIYTYVIVKTAATPTYVVFASQLQFK